MTARSSNCSVSAKFFPMLVEKPYFGGVINPKTYLNHELGSKFFFLSDLAYKLVNLLVFEKCSCKMSKNWTFQKIIGLGLNFTYEFEVCCKEWWNFTTADDYIPYLSFAFFQYLVKAELLSDNFLFHLECLDTFKNCFYPKSGNLGFNPIV